jgi:hypothetical protein
MIAVKASTVITVHEGLSASVPSTPVPELPRFVRRVIGRSGVKAPVVALASIYLDRLRTRLPPTARGTPSIKY